MGSICVGINAGAISPFFGFFSLLDLGVICLLKGMTAKDGIFSSGLGAAAEPLVQK